MKLFDIKKFYLLPEYPPIEEYEKCLFYRTKEEIFNNGWQYSVYALYYRIRRKAEVFESEYKEYLDMTSSGMYIPHKVILEAKHSSQLSYIMLHKYFGEDLHIVTY